MNTTPNPLADGNRFQRAYYRWALPYYERIGQKDPGLRVEVEHMDQFLYSRAGLVAWLGWLLSWLGGVLGLRLAGLSTGVALGVATTLWLGISIVLLSAWMAPLQGEPRAQRKLVHRFVKGLAIGAVSALLGVGVGSWLRHGRLDWERYEAVLKAGSVTLLLTGAGISLLAAAVSWASHAARTRRLQHAELLAERDAARATAAETELRLLQAQIHPHFVFNTLATLQHWVDKADPRAGPLLRELTGFLRRSTEMLGRSQVPLDEETQAAAHYLAIMQARMAERLRPQLQMDPRCAAQTLPPGLLLTLVENAIEHGLEPKIGGGQLLISSGGEGGAWWLRVDDDGMGLARGASDNVGLSNLRLRLQQHFGGRAHFSLSARPEGGTRAEIRFEEHE